LNGNIITSVPLEIGYFKNLERLHLENNQINRIADEIGCLRKLEEVLIVVIIVDDCSCI